MIGININGEAREAPEGLTLAALIDWLKLPLDRVAVEQNREIVPRRQWEQTPVRAGDQFEIVQFVGGGSKTAHAGARGSRRS
jgi:thiamine biosynthesis protein ThiS